MSRVYSRETDALAEAYTRDARSLGGSLFANREEGTGGFEVRLGEGGFELAALTQEELYHRECSMLRAEECRLRAKANEWLERAAKWRSESTKAEYQRVAGLEMAKADLVAKQVQSLMAARTKQIVAAHRAANETAVAS